MYTAVGYARPMPLLVYTTAGGASSDINVAYTAVGYISSEKQMRVRHLIRPNLGALYFPEFQKQVRQGAMLKYEVR